MRTHFTWTHSAIVALSLGIGAWTGTAAAQEPQQQQQSQPSAATSPSPAKDAAAAAEGDAKAQKAQQTPAGKMGTDEPSSHVTLKKDWEGPPLVNGALAVSGAPTDSQTVPAKFSARNASLDALPILAHPLPLDAAERRQVVDALKSGDAPVAAVKLGPAELVPIDVELRPLPPDVASGNAVLSGLSYVRLEDRIVFVRPSSRVVVGELAD